MTKRPTNPTLGDVYELIQNFRDEIKDDYVNKAEFIPVKMIVYGAVALILTGVMTALVAQVVKAIQ